MDYSWEFVPWDWLFIAVEKGKLSTETLLPLAWENSKSLPSPTGIQLQHPMGGIESNGWSAVRLFQGPRVFDHPHRLVHHGRLIGWGFLG